jgi:N-methylhydantoinase A
VGSVLSAAGALISDLSRSFEAPFHASDAAFDFDAVNGVLGGLERRARAFIDGPGRDAVMSTIEFSVEARYPHQVWELEVPLRSNRIDDPRALKALRDDFHAVHREVFGVADETSAVEFQSWHARARCQLTAPTHGRATIVSRPATSRRIVLPDHGAVSATVFRLEGLPIDERIAGPAIVETPTTTVVVDPGASMTRRPTGTLHIEPLATATETPSALSRTLEESR